MSEKIFTQYDPMDQVESAPVSKSPSPSVEKARVDRRSTAYRAAKVAPVVAPIIPQKTNAEEEKSLSIKANMAHKRQRDETKIKVRFRYLEVAGGALNFKVRFYDEPIKKYVLKDGEVYDLPRNVVEHLSVNCAYPVYEEVKKDVGMGVNPDDNTNRRVVRMENRFNFERMDFMDFDEHKGRISPQYNSHTGY